MKNEQPPISFKVSLALFMTMILSGCISVQVPSVSGRPKLIGFGDVHTNNCQGGQILAINAPGLSLRCDTTDPGISFGWHRMRLFYPAAGEGNSCRPVAIETRCLGVNLAPASLMIGYDSRFAIPLPSSGTPVVQTIEYYEINPTNTVIQQKEMK
jgi:hypothetical protein